MQTSLGASSEVSRWLQMSLEERLKHSSSPVSQRLFQTMIRKHSNLCVAADVRSCDHLLRLVSEVAPSICCLKTHVDVLEDWNQEYAEKLIQLSKTGDFLLFEDRKYSDIGHTVAFQYEKGGVWADFVSVHALPGIGVLDGLKTIHCSGEETQNRGAVIVAQMSSEGGVIMFVVLLVL